MRHNCATHRVIEILEMGTGNVRASRRCDSDTSNSELGPRLVRREPCLTALMPVVVRAVHVLVVRVVVIDFGVMQLIVHTRRIMPVLMRVSVLMVVRVAVRMLVHHVAMTVRMTMGMRMRVGVTMLVRMAVGLVVAMAMLVFAVGHINPP